MQNMQKCVLRSVEIKDFWIDY